MTDSDRSRPLIELAVHELRTPLNVAAGSLRQLAAMPGLDAAERAVSERALRACEQLERVTTQMRDWARLQSEAAPVHRTALTPALHQAARDVEAARPGVHVVVDERHGDTLQVMAVSGQLARALTGIIAAVARPVAAGSSIPVTTSGNGEHVSVQIGDTNGALHEALTFDMDGIGGLGFALALAQQIITASGGRAGLLLDAHGRVQGAVIALLRQE